MCVGMVRVRAIHSPLHVPQQQQQKCVESSNNQLLNEHPHTDTVCITSRSSITCKINSSLFSSLSSSFAVVKGVIHFV